MGQLEELDIEMKAGGPVGFHFPLGYFRAQRESLE